jgi:hypothetical protein
MRSHDGRRVSMDKSCGFVHGRHRRRVVGAVHHGGSNRHWCIRAMSARTLDVSHAMESRELSDGGSSRNHRRRCLG